MGVSSNGTAHLWDVITGAPVRSAALGIRGVTPLGLSPDRRWLLGSSAGGATGTTGVHFALWDLDSARPTLHVDVPASFFFVWGFSADNRSLAYTDTNGSPTV